MSSSNAVNFTYQAPQEYNILKGRGFIDTSSQISCRLFYTAEENEENSDKKLKKAIFNDLHRQELITDSQLHNLLEALRQE